MNASHIKAMRANPTKRKMVQNTAAFSCHLINNNIDRLFILNHQKEPKKKKKDRKMNLLPRYKLKQCIRKKCHFNHFH